MGAATAGNVQAGSASVETTLSTAVGVMTIPGEVGVSPPETAVPGIAPQAISPVNAKPSPTTPAIGHPLNLFIVWALPTYGIIVLNRRIPVFFDDRMKPDLLPWLLASGEPWTCYRALVDLAGRSEDDAEVRAARHAMLTHPQVKTLRESLITWGEQPLTRHNDASHPLYALSTLADFGVRVSDRGVKSRLRSILAHQAQEGAFLSPLKVSAAFGGDDETQWGWMACDAPTLLYSLVAMGLGQEARIRQAVHHIASLIDENGWHCTVSPAFGKFRGPGRKTDPCPVANVYALKALALLPDWRDSPATRQGTQMLLDHWQHQTETKYYLFGIGTDFRKLKYPFVWYDLLHVTEVLSHFPWVPADPRFKQMVKAVTDQADRDGRYIATSMYQSWKGWSFADKKAPSPWLTLAVYRILRRVEA